MGRHAQISAAELVRNGVLVLRLDNQQQVHGRAVPVLASDSVLHPETARERRRSAIILSAPTATPTPVGPEPGRRVARPRACGGIRRPWWRILRRLGANDSLDRYHGASYGVHIGPVWAPATNDAFELD